MPNIPPLPSGLTPPPQSGLDPKVFIPRDLSGAAGQSISVPVKIEVTEPLGITVSGFDILIEFDPNVLAIESSALGALFTGSDLTLSAWPQEPGRIIFSADAINGSTLFPQGTLGDLLTIHFAIAAGAPAGASPINLLFSHNSGTTGLFDNTTAALSLNPLPTNDPADEIDGSLIITDSGATVVGRHVFYNNSYFDGKDPAAGLSDDDAIALRVAAEDSGTYLGSNNQSQLIDATKSWSTNAWVGYWIVNPTDGSHGRITANTADTITATLARGAENDWDSGDGYKIVRSKTPLVAGEKATFDHYSNYSLGLNGIMVDIAGLPAGAVLGTEDFSFHVGNSNTPGSWQTLAQASIALPTIAAPRELADQPGVSRITLTWPDNAIVKRWLQVTVLATPQTGLAAADEFFFGNAVGETGNSSSDALVNLSDVILTRNNQTGFSFAEITNAYDVNRDRLVNLSDVILTRNNQSGFNPLLLIDLTAYSPPGAQASMVDGAIEEMAEETNLEAQLATWYDPIERQKKPTENFAQQSAVDRLFAAGLWNPH